MADGDRVEAAGTYSDVHRCLGPFKKGYDRAAVAAANPFHVIYNLCGRVAALDHDAPAGREQGRQTFQDAPDLPRRDSIWWICKYQMEFAPHGDEPPEHLRNVPTQHFPLSHQPCTCQVLPDDACRPLVPLDEGCLFTTTAQSL